MMAKQLLKILKGEKPDYIVNPQVFKDLDLSNIKL